MEGKTQLIKFTFYDLYAGLMDTLTDKKLVYLWGNIVNTLVVLSKKSAIKGRS